MSRHVSSHKRQAKLTGSTLEGANFNGADLTGANLGYVKAKKARLA